MRNVVCFSAAGLLVSLLIAKKSLSKEHQVTKTGLAEEEAKRKEAQEKKRLSKEVKREGRRSGEVPKEDV